MIRNYFSKVFDVLFPPSCIRCQTQGQQLCERCTQQLRRAIDTPHIFIYSIFSFKDPMVKRIIHSIKYYHRRDLIIPLAKVLAQEMRKQNYIGTLVPIPMPKWRLSMRGYNQADEIAKILSKELNMQIRSDLLVRNGNTKRQVETKTRNARLSNQKNSFQIAGNGEGLDIILVDDVTTTGATIVEARKVLLSAGARTVRAVTLAH